MQAKGTKTYNKVIAEIRGMLKNFTDEKFTKKQIFDEIYNRIAEFYSLSGTSHDPKYADTITLTPATSQGGFVPESNGCTYTNSTRTVYIPAALWGGCFSTGLTDATKLPIGAKVILYLAAGGDNVWSSTIASITDATHFVLTDAYGSNLGTDDFRVAVIFGDTGTDEIDISTLGDYKHINDITSIEDSLHGLCTKKSEKDFIALSKLTDEENPYENEIIWTLIGTRLRFYKGGLASYGTRTMNIDRSPLKPTAFTDYVDYPDTGLRLLEDAVCLTVLQAINAPIPAVLSNSKKEIDAQRTAIAEKRAKIEANAKT